MSAFPTRLAHGSERRDPALLKPSPCATAFGPGLYLTADWRTTDFYARGAEGTIHIVDVMGDPAWTLDLDAQLAAASQVAQRIIDQGRRWLSASAPLDPERPAREALHWAVGSGREPVVNPCLARLGLWMVYGTLSGMEQSGAMDVGVQYCVIRDGHVKPVTAIPVSDPDHREKVARRMKPSPPAQRPPDHGIRM